MNSLSMNRTSVDLYGHVFILGLNFFQKIIANLSRCANFTFFQRCVAEIIEA